MKKTLDVKATIQVSKPINQVFEAIVDPARMSNYFIANSTGRMETGKKLTWHFPEFKVDVPVRIGKIEKDSYISFYWEGAKDKELLVEIALQDVAGSKTVVTVIEKGMNNDDEGIEWLGRNTEGWANFLACLKAYLEYGINLRKGAFDFMGDK